MTIAMAPIGTFRAGATDASPTVAFVFGTTASKRTDWRRGTSPVSRSGSGAFALRRRAHEHAQRRHSWGSGRCPNQRPHECFRLLGNAGRGLRRPGSAPPLGAVLAPSGELALELSGTVGDPVLVGDGAPQGRATLTGPPNLSGGLQLAQQDKHPNPLSRRSARRSMRRSHRIPR